MVVATGYNINFVLFVFFKVDLTLPGQLYHPELLNEERYVFINWSLLYCISFSLKPT